MFEFVTAALAVLQLTAMFVLAARLAPGYRRPKPVAPHPEGIGDTTVSAIVPTLDEAGRVGACLEHLSAQGPPLVEILVVDSGSTDGTREVVLGAARRDPRVQLTSDPPRPPDWIGKVWALQHGLSLVTGEWVLGMDADTRVVPGAVAGIVTAARERTLDVASFSPTFDSQGAFERWLQPSMLMTLVYRLGAPTDRPRAGREMANGQCFLASRAVLERHGGYRAARGSFADDVALARAYAARGARVGFLDGRRLYRVCAYTGAAEMWREWGRSFDLTDVTPPARQRLDLVLIVLAQGLPLPVLLSAALTGGAPSGWTGHLLLWASAALFSCRLAMTFAIAGSYARRGLPFWLSPLSDPAAAARLVLSTFRRPRVWRGRRYDDLRR